jgi:hypothetical protein
VRGERGRIAAGVCLAEKGVAVLTALTANAVGVAVEPVWIRRQDGETAGRDVSAVQVGWRRRNARVWIRRVAVLLCWRFGGRLHRWGGWWHLRLGGGRLLRLRCNPLLYRRLGRWFVSLPWCSSPFFCAGKGEDHEDHCADDESDALSHIGETPVGGAALPAGWRARA